MGCLNSTGSFSHWFGNIHFSGACNRSCYFCIGQHMMALDALNSLDQYPLLGIDKFLEECNQHEINDINLTGSNTDPLLYRHIEPLYYDLLKGVRKLRFGIRTNGALLESKRSVMGLFDNVSISLPSLVPEIYQAMMGSGTPPRLNRIIDFIDPSSIKINVVLGPENRERSHLLSMFRHLELLGIHKVNLREPYGQPHIGSPLDSWAELGRIQFGMPVYWVGAVEVTYWDVHFVEVESVNLYANGIVSVDYPITRGHDPIYGTVQGQEHFTKSGRVHEQWLQKKP